MSLFVTWHIFNLALFEFGSQTYVMILKPLNPRTWMSHINHVRIESHRDNHSGLLLDAPNKENKIWGTTFSTNRMFPARHRSVGVLGIRCEMELFKLSGTRQ